MFAMLSKVILLATAALALGGCLAGPSVHTEVQTIPALTSEALHARREAGENIVVLDVREENEFLELHIPGAIWFPKSKFDKGDKGTLAKLDTIDKAATVVSYCGAGHRSSYVTRKLSQMGYKAHNLEGVSFWEQKGLPLIRGPKRPPSREPAFIRLEEAYQHYYLLFEDVVWVDVRSRKGYHRGHIKGALSVPLTTLEDNLSKIPKNKEIVLYCSGTWGGGTCTAAKSAGRILIESGYSSGKIKVFEDGFGTWKQAGYPVVSKSLLRTLFRR